MPAPESRSGSQGPAPGSMFKAMAGEALAFALNRLVALDPDMPAELARLDGRRFQMTWAGPEWALEARVVAGRIEIRKPDEAEAPDFSVRATLSGLAGLLRPETRGVLPVGKVQVSGDAELLRSVEQLAKKYQPDLEVAFGDRLGPVFGPQLARVLQSILDGVRAQGVQFVDTSADYALHEADLVTTRERLQDFVHDVDHLRDDVERFEARLDRLANP